MRYLSYSLCGLISAPPKDWMLDSKMFDPILEPFTN